MRPAAIYKMCPIVIMTGAVHSGPRTQHRNGSALSAVIARAGYAHIFYSYVTQSSRHVKIQRRLFTWKYENWP